MIWTLLRWLLTIVVVATLIWLGYFFWQHKRLPSLNEVQNTSQSTLEHIPYVNRYIGKAEVSSSMPSVEVSEFASRAGELTEEAKRVLGESIQVASESDKPASQRALDYGRYLYCQQVVKEYEAQQ